MENTRSAKRLATPRNRSARLARPLIIFALLAAFAGGLSAHVTAAPTPVSAYYFFDTTAASLQTDSFNRGKLFSQNSPGGTRLLTLDYGAARDVPSPGSGAWGTQIFGNSGVEYTNSQLLSALEQAADGVHNGYTGVGSTIVAYGNNNSYMTSHGMSNTDAYDAGFYQSQRAQDLASYQSAKGYNKQSAAIGQDQEPGFDLATISRNLTDGATHQGYALNYDYGSADGCYPDNNGGGTGSSGPCANGWTAGDVGWVSFSGTAVPLPEMYYDGNGYAHQPEEWTNVRTAWNATQGAGYEFWGTTGETGANLTATQGWTDLNNNNPGYVLNELVCFGC